jgi:hypothetical protein
MFRFRWDPTERMVEEKLRTAARTFPTVKKRILQEFGRGVQKRVVQLIRDGDFIENAPHYRRWKESRGFSTLPLNRSGDYANGIRSEVRANGALFVFPTGIDRHTKRDGYAPLPYTQIGLIMEYGTGDGRIPARPHWRPTGEWAQQQLPEVGRRIASEALGLSRIYRGTWDVGLLSEER